MMKNAVIFLSIVLAGFFITAAYADNNAAAGVSAQAGVPQRGALYRIRHQHHTTHLFGTIHVGVPSFFPLEPQVMQALRHSTTLVLEVDIRNREPFQRALQKHGLYANDDTIDRHLSADTLAQLQQALQRYDVPFDSVKHMKPWVVTNMLLGLELARHGYHHNHGVEQFLLSFAGGSARRVQALESAEYQMSLFDGMGTAAQEQYLRENLSGLSDGNALKEAQELIDAWSDASGDGIEKLMRESLNEKTVSSDFTQRILLDQRNPEMADKIEALFKNDASAFVGIGLLHLIGERGIPALLRQRGYVVERLY
jgi:uncharacterized protein YbaP (TraB family)